MTMSEHYNHLGQPIGFPVPGWQARPWPPRTTMQGRYCHVEPLKPGEHAADLFQAYAADSENRNWTYLLNGPFATFAAYQAWMETTCLGDDPLFYAIINLQTGTAVGIASYLRIHTHGNGSHVSHDAPGI
jgi:hypothetical protein